MPLQCHKCHKSYLQNELKFLMTAFINAVITSDDVQCKLSREVLSSRKKMETALGLMLDIGGLYDWLRTNGAKRSEQIRYE